MTTTQKQYIDISDDELNLIILMSEATIVDVREAWEYEEFNIGGMNIEMNDIREKRNWLMPYEHIVVVCTNGTRSRIAARDFCQAEQLQSKHIYHLKGGLLGIEE